MKVSCPVTGQSHQVSVDVTPCGSLIRRCSRFVPSDEVHCGGTCAAAIDRELAVDRAHRAERVLVLYGNSRHTESIAHQIGAFLSFDGLVVEYADTDASDAPPPEDYDAVVVGFSPRFRRPPRSIVKYIEDHRASLRAHPTFLFLVGGIAAKDLRELADRTGWLPQGVATFARPEEAGMPDLSALRSFVHAVGDAIPATELRLV